MGTGHGFGLGSGLRAEGDGTPSLGREDTFRLLAISNTILALVLVGVLVLQSGQWYTERKELDEAERMAAEKTLHVGRKRHHM